MQETYEEAITQVFKSEGGYTNESTDPGGPTNWGITIADARKYWKDDATAKDVKDMPKSVAEGIYIQHYARPIQYDLLPAGVDYSVLDYSINSGISRAVKTLQSVVGVTQDGFMGPLTLQALQHMDSVTTINEIWSHRLSYDKSLTHLWPTYGRGWTTRCSEGNALALSLQKRYSVSPVASIDPTNAAFNNPLDSLISKVNKLFHKGK